MSPGTNGRVQRELDRLHRMVTGLLLLGVAIVLGVAIFAWHEVHTLKANQQDLQQLTDDLCVTLERAGIFIQGTGRHRCER